MHSQVAEAGAGVGVADAGVAVAAEAEAPGLAAAALGPAAAAPGPAAAAPGPAAALGLVGVRRVAAPRVQAVAVLRRLVRPAAVAVDAPRNCPATVPTSAVATGRTLATAQRSC